MFALPSPPFLASSFFQPSSKRNLRYAGPRPSRNVQGVFEQKPLEIYILYIFYNFYFIIKVIKVRGKLLIDIISLLERRLRRIIRDIQIRSYEFWTHLMDIPFFLGRNTSFYSFWNFFREELRGVFRVRVERNAKGGFWSVTTTGYLRYRFAASCSRDGRNGNNGGSEGERERERGLMGWEIDYLVGTVAGWW